MKFKLKYIDKNFEQSDAIHLDLGTLLHKILELKYQYMIKSQSVDYEYLASVLENGVLDDESDKDQGTFIMGLQQIKEKYGLEKFTEVDEKSGLSYEDKLYIFEEYLKNDELGEGWKVLATELEFEFDFEDRVIFGGFIDRIDINESGDLRVVDYKSSNKVFADKDLTTPLQMMIYALACENLYGKTPIEFQYDMILLGEKQFACTKGYYNRGLKKINKTLDEIDWFKSIDDWKPKPTPLCHWCEFCENNPNSVWTTNYLCEYYSLWTPDRKTFAVNKEYK